MPPEDYGETLMDVPWAPGRIRFGARHPGCGQPAVTAPSRCRLPPGSERFMPSTSIPTWSPEPRHERWLPARATCTRSKGHLLRELGYLPGSGRRRRAPFQHPARRGAGRFAPSRHSCAAPRCLIAVIHWRTDLASSRGPSADIRPTPEQVLQWGTALVVSIPRQFLSPAAMALRT